MSYKKPAFWVILLTLVASIVACVLLLTNPAAKNTTLMGANYKVTELLYSTADEDDDRYSRFMITADYMFYAQLEGRDTWNVREKMEKYPLTAKNIKEYTARESGWISRYGIKEITDAYICRVENDYFYLAVQTKNGDTLLGFGWEDVPERGQDGSDDTYLRYLYKVESEFSENEFNVNFFAHSLLDAVGVTDCFEAYTNKENPGFMVVGFISDYNDQAEHGYNDMGFAVFQAQNNGYRLLNYHVYQDAANQNEGIIFCDHPAVMSLDGAMDRDVTFDVILSCNENLDKIQREYYKDDELTKQIASTHLGAGKSMTLFRWDELVGSNLRIKQYYLDSAGNEISFEEYGEAVNYDNLMAMVEDIAHNPDCAASSNPFDYIEAKKALYDEIISYGSSAVELFVSQLRTGENGLQGYIMAVACADITGIGDKDTGADWATAQEWLALYEKSDGNTTVGGADGPHVVYSKVKLTDSVSDSQESSYKVNAFLSATDLTNPGQILADKIASEWSTFDNMTLMQQYASSHLWGVVYVNTETWNACEQAVGVTIDNPLETIDWLNKTGYFGMESADPNTPVTHVKATAYATHSTDRKLDEIHITAGYHRGNVQITLSATVSATAGTITTGGVTRGYATFEYDTTTTGSGTPVLIVTTNETNNLGYYNGDYLDPTAYWVKDNVIYTLRVFGDEVNRTEIQETLELILAKI